MHGMHRIHGIEMSETDSGQQAIMIKLVGELDDGMEPILRLEFDKTLVRKRQGGVILDLRGVSHLANSVKMRIIAFAKHLQNDGIELVIVTPRRLDVAEMLIDSADKFSMIPSLNMAKEMLDITE